MEIMEMSARGFFKAICSQHFDHICGEITTQNLDQVCEKLFWLPLASGFILSTVELQRFHCSDAEEI
jgi:uncharacterized protein YgiB involved in biofilm formation